MKNEIGLYRLQYATNSVDIITFGNYVLRIDCNKAEEGLKNTQCSLCFKFTGVV